MWKQSGRSSALERAQAVLSSRRGRAAPAATAHLAPRMSQGGAVHAPPARMSSELLSDLSDSESSLSPGLGQDHRPGATVPNHTSDWVPEVPKFLTPLDSGAIRFLKRPSAAAQDQPKERAVPSSLLASQAAALSRLAQIENRFGKSMHTKGSLRTEQTAVQEFTEETRALSRMDQPSTDQPSMVQPSMVQPSMVQPSMVQPSRDQPRRFVKSRPLGAHWRHSEESNGRLQLHTEAPPVLHPPLTSPRNTWLVQPQANPSPGSMSPSPACLSPSAPSLPPSPPCLSSVGSACEALEELLPLEAASDAHSDRSDSSGCFRLNLMNLDELALAALLLEEHPNAQEPELQEVHEEEVETVHEEEVETVHEEEVETVHEEEVETVHVEEVSEEEVEEVHEEDYPSDFESVIQTEGISEHSQDSGQPPSPRSQSNYSNMFTRATPSDPCTLEPPPHSHAPLPKPDTTSVGLASRLPAVCNPCPSLGLLMQSLRQQLALTSHFISSAQEQRTRLLEGLGPPSYRYTTLQDTLQYISILGASRSHSDQQTARR